MTTDLRTPLHSSTATKSGRGLYWKRILPHGTELKVRGQTLRCTPELSAKAKQTFDAGFLDVTPFTLVNDDNSHTDDPERVRGRVRDLSVRADGLYGLIDAPDSLFEHNPDLPVSVRMKFDEERADGRKAAVVLAHVAGTNDPHVGGMGPWQRVADLSADPDPDTVVVDLTAATYQGDTMDLKPEEIAALSALAARLNADGSMKDEQTNASALEPDDDPEFEAFLAELENVETDDVEPEPVALSANGDIDPLDLANATAAQAVNRLDAIEAELAAEKWKAKATALKQAGVPPYMVDLAAPVLGVPDGIDLSATDVDPRRVVADMLDKCPRLDLSAERGSGYSAEPDDNADFVAAWRKQFS